MINEKILLRDDGSAYMDTYVQYASPEMPGIQKKPAVVVLPGGGYYMCSDREAEPVALGFLTKGCNSFVVRYSCGETAASFPNPLVDVSRAIKIIRQNAEKWFVNPDKIFVCGFSAGGHLTASLGNLWNDPEIQEKADCPEGENKPNGLILIYPVISFGQYGHDTTTMLPLVGNDHRRQELVEKLSNEKNVGPQTPEAFIAHTFSDNDVPVENSIIYAKALADANIPFELHVFREGRHGLALADENTYAWPGSDQPDFAQWMDLCGKWIHRVCGLDGVPGCEKHYLDLEGRARVY